MSNYRAQDRGDASSYQRYLAGMDASMRQKVALTAAHLLAEGVVADMGSGSGAGSDALAALYPRLQVIGVDVSPNQIEHASKTYGARSNLRFVVGDAAEPVFGVRTLHGIFDSSMLHHVTSFNDYDKSRARRALEVQASQLAPGGVLIVRDFVDPGEGEVLLDLPADDGDDSDSPATCSTAALFRRFSRDFRLLATDHRRGFPYVENSCPRAGWLRFRTTRTLAAEFVLRKDYRADWALEAQEEYTYATQPQMEAMFAELGLRVLASTPIWNPWIVKNRFEGKLEIRTADTGALEEYPPTNYLVVGERVSPGEGVAFRVRRSEAQPSFLHMMHHQDVSTGQVLDLVRRPNDTLDVIPWFVESGAAYILARMSYPRPILAVDGSEEPPLDGARPPHYVTEPLVVMRTDMPLGLAVEEALVSRAGIEASQIRGFTRGAPYYPSPGGLAEEVRAIHVEIEPVFVDRPLPGISGFSTSGRIGAIEARQLLRAAQVGGLPDARLELNTYALLMALGHQFGPWIGESIALDDGPAPRVPGRLLHVPPRRRFERAESASGFLGLEVLDVEEIDAHGQVVATGRREMVVPLARSRHSLACAVLRRAGGLVWIGLQDHDLPAAQLFSGSSHLWVAPAWRVPRGVSTRREADAWVTARIAEELGVEVVRSWALGGRYHPSAGVTPEVVYPRAIEVKGDGSLTWVKLGELIEHIDTISDGHLRILALRAAHALS